MPNAETLVSLSEVLQVDLNLLLTGETNTHIAAADLNLDLPLLERFRDLQKVPRRDREAVILLIDSVLTRGEVEQRLKKTRRLNAQSVARRC